MAWFRFTVLAGLLVPAQAPASNFFVDTFNDAVDAAPGDGICADASANCTLRAAVMESNALTGADTINLAGGTYTLTIPGNAEHAAVEGDLDILDSVTISGIDPQSTIIDGGGIDRIFEIINSPNVVISRLTVQNGVAGSNVSGYFVNFAGGGIFHVGSPSTLIISEVDVRNNSAQIGGGIYNIFSTLQLHDSAVYGNTAIGGSGGGVVEGLASFAQIRNSTISGNSATLHGGGVVTSNNQAVFNNVTITNNTSDSDNDGSGNGGGIYRGITAPNLRSTILAGNSDLGGEMPDCAGGVTSSGYNVVGDDSGCIVTANTGDQIGHGGSPLDPRLAPLADNGGPTQTHALLNGSPALDNGNPSPPGSGGNACEASDQRGTDRTALAPCDSGALENTPSPGISFTVNDASDQVDAVIGDGACETVPGNNVCTLRAAIQETNALIGADQVVLPADNYVLGIAGVNENDAATGDLDINDDLELLGADSVTTVIDANLLDRIFHTHGSSNFSLSGVTLKNGMASGGTSDGGAISHQSGNTLTVSDSIITANSAASGGGIFTVAFNYVVINDSVISNNTATTYGGGIANFTLSNTTLINSTISGNSANIGGGLMNSFMSFATLTGTTISDNQAQYGGGIGTLWGNGVVTLINSTVSGNRASFGGGGLSVSLSDTVNLRNSTITANRATAFADGGGIATSGTVNMRNSIIAGNSDDGGEAPDCIGALSSQGYNILGDNTACSFTAGTGDQIGDAITPIDPLLGPLTGNGSTNYSHALLTGSPALNAGNPATAGSGGSACEAMDQRNIDRILNAPCDTGSVEMVTADLGIALTDSFDPVLPGDALDYSITVNNAGPDTAANIVVTDTLPNSASFVSASGSGWICTFAAPVVSCTLTSLTSSSSSALAISISTPTASGTFTNSVSVSADTVDLNGGNDGATELTVVNAAPVLGASASSTFVIGNSAVPIAADATVTDIDDTHLESAQVQITSGYQSNQDVLSFTDSDGITGNWDATTGTLTLTGTGTTENYQDALRSIRYTNTSAAAVTGVRIFSHTASDGDAGSNTASSLLTVAVPVPEETDDQPYTPPPAGENQPVGGGVVSVPGSPVDSGMETTETGIVANDTNTNTHRNENRAKELQQGFNKTDLSQAKPPTQRRSKPTQTSAPYSRQRGNVVNRNASRKPQNKTAAAQQNSLPAKPAPTADSPRSEFSYLHTIAGNKALWNQLDSMKQQIHQAAEENSEQEKLIIGTAKSASLVLFAGIMNWYLKAGSLLASLISSAPLWAPFDPLPILSLSRQERNRRRTEDEKKKQVENLDQADIGRLLDNKQDTLDTRNTGRMET